MKRFPCDPLLFPVRVSPTYATCVFFLDYTLHRIAVRKNLPSQSHAVYSEVDID